MLSSSRLLQASRGFNKNTAAAALSRRGSVLRQSTGTSSLDRGISKRRSKDYINATGRNSGITAILRDASGGSSGAVYSQRGWKRPVSRRGIISSYLASRRGGDASAMDQALLEPSEVRRRWHVSAGISTAQTPVDALGDDPIDRLLLGLLPIAIEWETADNCTPFSVLPPTLWQLSYHAHAESLRRQRDASSSSSSSTALEDHWCGVGATSRLGRVAAGSIRMQTNGHQPWQAAERGGSAHVATVIAAFSTKIKSVHVLGLGTASVFLLLRLTSAFGSWDISPGFRAALLVAVAERLLPDVVEKPSARMLECTRMLCAADCSLRRSEGREEEEEEDDAAYARGSQLLCNVAPHALPQLWSALPQHWLFLVKRSFFLDAVELLCNCCALSEHGTIAVPQVVDQKYGVSLAKTSPAIRSYQYLRHVLRLSSASSSISGVLLLPHRALIQAAAPPPPSSGTTIAAWDATDVAAAAMCAVLFDVVGGVVREGHAGVELYERVTLQKIICHGQPPEALPEVRIPSSVVRASEAVRWIAGVVEELSTSGGFLSASSIRSPPTLNALGLVLTSRQPINDGPLCVLLCRRRPLWGLRAMCDSVVATELTAMNTSIAYWRKVMHCGEEGVGTTNVALLAHPATAEFQQHAPPSSSCHQDNACAVSSITSGSRSQTAKKDQLLRPLLDWRDALESMMELSSRLDAAGVLSTECLGETTSRHQSSSAPEAVADPRGCSVDRGTSRGSSTQTSHPRAALHLLPDDDFVA